MKKKENFLKRFWKKIRLFAIIFLIFSLIFWAVETSLSENSKCISQGYEGSLTMLGIPLHQCYIDNREFKEQTNKIDIYPLR